jgi:hypothetical protein
MEAPAQVVEQAQHLETDRDVEHRDRLVSEENPRPGGERAGERDALALTTGKLVRVLSPNPPKNKGFGA